MNVPMRLLLLLLAAAAAGAARLTVGYLANIRGKNRQGHIISGAMTYAVRQANERRALPGNYSLEFVFEDTRGETLDGTNAVIGLWRRGVVAFFGPENSCEVEATVAAALNLPMISYKCADSADKDDIANKDYRDHFARTYPPNTKVTSSVLELLRYYKWYKFSIVYESSEMYDAVMRSLERAVHEPFVIHHRASFRNTRICCYSKQQQNCCYNPFVRIVQNTSADTRIYVFLGDTTDLVKMLTALQVRGLLATGNYMVIYIDMESYTEEMAHKYFRLHEVSVDDAVVRSAQSLLVLVPTPPRGDRYREFQDEVRRYNAEEPFRFKSSELFTEWVAHITPYASYLYDAVTLYADALGKALRNRTDPRDGKEIMRIFRERTQYTSVTGAVMRIDKDGGAEGNYTVLSWQPTPDHLQLKMPFGRPVPARCMLPVGRFYAVDDGTLRFQLEREILWVNPDKPPVDEPPCGFDGSQCTAAPDRTREFVAAALSSVCVLSSFLVYMVYRNWKYEQEIDGLLWRLDLSEIQRCGQEGGVGTCLVHSASKMSLVSVESRTIEQIFTHTALYKGGVIALKQLRLGRKIADVSRRTKKEMKSMREMHSDNINQFIGACVDPNCVYVVTEYCSKGSLQDILENDDMKLDNMFIASLVFDLIKGMIFLHESDLRFHGNLKSSNCVVSSRWVLQITDFGLHELRASAETGSVTEHQHFRNLLWKAPELLRDSPHPFGSQKGDVYAFGIILHEIIGRQGPFGTTDLTPKEIVRLVMSQGRKEPFRPPVQDIQCQDYIVNAMRDSWAERPDGRPDFHHLKERLRKMREGMKSNIMDHMMAMMEKYAYNLEELVDERTVALVEEKKKTEALLHRMLPKSVANQLMRGESVVPESFDAVTIYFSDIVGFTEMSATSTPMEVVAFLNDLYTVFDDIISHYDVYKVETIGDAYMVVSGLPLRNGDDHAGEIAFMALELLDSIRSFRIRHKPSQTLKLRIGIHTGPVCSGVVGLTMPRYCLFGDTVNTASRMESNGEALKIHISPQCKEYLDKLGGYYTQDRGLVRMKGKGEIRTYWLIGHVQGPKKRTHSASESIPPQPLFHVPRGEERRRSPKLGDRRGSLVGRRNSSFLTGGDDPPPSPGALLPFLRASDSPRSPKRMSSFGRGDPTRWLRVREGDSSAGSWCGGGSASSCGELHAIEDGTELKTIQLAPRSHFKKDRSKGSGDSTRGASSDRNGRVSVDESLRPLLCEPKDAETHFLKPPAVRPSSKKWRSCDEIVQPKISRPTLRVYFARLLQDRAREEDRTVQESVREESLV